MAELNALSSFATFKLSQQEELMGSIYTYEQKMFIQNKIAEVAEQKLSLIVDPINYTVFLQQEAFCAGQISILRYLLDCSLTSEQVLLDGSNQ